MRDAFIQALMEAAEARDNVALVVGDLGFGVVEPFAGRFPKRFFNAGVAEQNMMGLAAGLASEGFHVFAYSIANFPTFRCAEQIRNDVDYHRLPVTVVAVGGGLAYGNLGYSHHAIQDYALMRVMPNLLIAAPADPAEVGACVHYLVDHPQPSYLRLGKAGEARVHAGRPEIAPGRWLPVRVPAGAPGTLLATGATLELALALAASAEYAGWAVHTLPLWGMRQKSEQARQVEAWPAVVSIEDHLQDAGFGSWLREALPPGLAVRVRGLCLDPVVCGLVAKQSTLNAVGGLAPAAAVCGSEGTTSQP